MDNAKARSVYFKELIKKVKLVKKSESERKHREKVDRAVRQF